MEAQDKIAAAVSLLNDAMVIDKPEQEAA